MRCDLENMLRQVQEALSRRIEHSRREATELGPYHASIQQLREHIQQVREGRATLDEFAHVYMLHPGE